MTAVHPQLNSLWFFTAQTWLSIAFSNPILIIDLISTGMSSTRSVLTLSPFLPPCRLLDAKSISSLGNASALRSLLRLVAPTDLDAFLPFRLLAFLPLPSSSLLRSGFAIRWFLLCPEQRFGRL
jgi:hypothetical protein